MGDTWTPREGAYGRTRDGRRVGPLVVCETTRSNSYVWAEHGVPSGDTWTAEGVFHVGCDSPSCRDSDLVAEWAEPATSYPSLGDAYPTGGPVRTVTRREIVPGVYGRLLVDLSVPEFLPGNVGLRLADRVGKSPGVTHWFNADELDAAAAVLTQLAEALRNG